jgi:hypothetical protein
VAAAILCGGCAWFKRTDGLADVAKMPLAPTLRLSPSVTGAAIPYQNACGQPASLPIAGPLAETIHKQLERVFQSITRDTGAGSAAAPDGTVEVALGLQQIDLAIHRPVAKPFPVTATLGMDLVFRAEDGTVLFNKKLQSAGHG